MGCAATGSAPPHAGRLRASPHEQRVGKSSAERCRGIAALAAGTTSCRGHLARKPFSRKGTARATVGNVSPRTRRNAGLRVCHTRTTDGPSASAATFASPRDPLSGPTMDPPVTLRPSRRWSLRGLPRGDGEEPRATSTSRLQAQCRNDKRRAPRGDTALGKGTKPLLGGGDAVDGTGAPKGWERSDEHVPVDVRASAESD